MEKTPDTTEHKAACPMCDAKTMPPVLAFALGALMCDAYGDLASMRICDACTGDWNQALQAADVVAHTVTYDAPSEHHTTWVEMTAQEALAAAGVISTTADTLPPPAPEGPDGTA